MQNIGDDLFEMNPLVEIKNIAKVHKGGSLDEI